MTLWDLALTAVIFLALWGVACCAMELARQTWRK